MSNNEEQEIKIDSKYFKEVGQTIRSSIANNLVIMILCLLYFVFSAHDKNIIFAIFNALSFISYGFSMKDNNNLRKKHNAIVKTLKL